eukprot:TRINITY_DN9500_c0_g1_i1.p2 TRINITY_DN9500_c0_g1~~TRINITY_DN9500_c0_g1_i1.p2  ORF type:complete len:232 (+),score=82.99 TRINITY_DN9500_c0_g1_i1:75-698(+)
MPGTAAPAAAPAGAAPPPSAPAPAAAGGKAAPSGAPAPQKAAGTAAPAATAGKSSDKQGGEAEEKRLEAARAGLRLNWMSMCDGETGDKLWHEAWGPDMWDKEQTARIPKEVLECSSVTRALSFSSSEPLEHFRMVQRVLLRGQQIEEWAFNFGFVIPGSTNEWSSTVQAADEMIPPEVLSGHAVIETSFYDGDVLLRTQTTRCFYE